MTWALTPWGLVCRDVADEFIATYPQFSIGIGPDEESLVDRGYRITFVVLDGSFDDPRTGGNDETHPTFDEELPIRINIHVLPTIDPETKYDTSPVLLERVKERLLEAIDASRHTPYFKPRSIARRGGHIDSTGSEIIIVAVMRIVNCRTPAILAPIIQTTMGLTAEDFAGETDKIEVIGEP